MSNWFSLTAEETLRHIHSNVNGLTREEVIRSRIEHGRNVLPQPKPRALAVVFLLQLLTPFTLLLAIALTISGFLGEWVDVWAISAVLLLNASLGTYFERKTRILTLKLQNLTPRKVKVRREGRAQIISTPELVVGDIVLLEAGQHVPADCRLLESNVLRVDESILTGESLPQNKDAELVFKHAELPEQKNMIFMGTVVTHGKGEGIVVAVGAQTAVGTIEHIAADAESPDSPLVSEIKSLNTLIAVATLVISIFFLGLIVLQGGGFLEGMKAAAALAVSTVPEGLPMLITLGLLLGVHRMAQKRALVKNLAAIDTMAYLSTLVTDKTGTITENNMQAKTVFLPGVAENQGTPITEINPFTTGLSRLLKSSVLANEAAFEPDAAALHDPLEHALLEAATSLNVDARRIIKSQRPLLVVPFSSQNKYMAACYRINTKQVVWYLKGAPEVIMQASKHVIASGHPQHWAAAERKAVSAAIEEASQRTEKVIAFAERPTDLKVLEAIKKNPESASAVLLQDLTFLGAMGLADPLRKDAAQTVAELKKLGIQVKIATGDHAATASAIAHQIGLSPETISHQHLSTITASLVKKHSVFARVQPLDKLKIVKALQRQGQTVAMTGDGVNDAPALKQADIGITLGRAGTDASREVSDIILLNDSLKTILTAISYGRVLTQNIRLVTLFALIVGAAEVMIIVCSTLLGNGVGALVPTQVLWLNLLTGTPLALPLLYENQDPNKAGVRKGKHAGLWDQAGLAIAASAGLVLGTLIQFFILRAMYPDQAIIAQSATFYTVCFGELALIYSLRQPHRLIFQYWRENKVMIYGSLGVIATQIAAFTIPSIQAGLHLTPLTLKQVGFALLIASSGLFAGEMYKVLSGQVKVGKTPA